VPFYDFFPHNWATEVAMATVWTTQVDVSENRLAETRRNLVDAPRRTITVRWSGLRQSIATRLLFEIMRSADSQRRIPLYQDVSVTTASSSSTTINCPTTYRRFYAGRLVLITESDGTNPQFDTIDSLTASAITLTTGLSGSYAAGALVFPVLVTEVLLDAQLGAITDQVAEVTADYVEAELTMQAAGSWSGLSGYGFQQIGSFAYLLGVAPEWRNGIAFRMQRSGSSNVYARTQSVSTRGPRALLSMDLSFTFGSRAAFWTFLQFFDAHRGRALPFWVESPLTLWEPSAVTTTYLDVTSVGDLTDYTNFVESIEGGSPFLLIEKTDGTKVLAQITGTTEPGGGVFRLAATLPSMTLSEILRASLAFFVRFETDTLVERWRSAGVVEVAVSVVELLRWENETATAGNDGFFSGGVGQLCD